MGRARNQNVQALRRDGRRKLNMEEVAEE